MAPNYEPPASFLFNPEVILAILALLTNVNGGLFSDGNMRPRRHTLADIAAVRRMFHEYATTRAPGVRYDEVYLEWINFTWVVSLLIDAIYTTILRPGYKGALMNEGPFSNDFTILKMPVGGPQWPSFLLNADRVTFTRITNLVYTGTIDSLPQDVSI
jgi:hypothetical protein